MKYVKGKKGRMERKRGSVVVYRVAKGTFILNIAAVVGNELYFYRVVKSRRANIIHYTKNTQPRPPSLDSKTLKPGRLDNIFS